MLAFFSDPVASGPLAADERSNGGGPGTSAAWDNRALVSAVAGGVVAAVLAVVLGEVVLYVYRGALQIPVTQVPVPENIRRFKAARIICPALTFGGMAGLLGLVMGVAGGLARGSGAKGIIPGLSALLAGSLGVAAITWAVATLFFQVFDPQANDLMTPLLMHGSIWLVVGAIGGVSFGAGLGAGRWKSAAVGGVAGALVATVTSEMLGALFFASSKTDLPISESVASRALVIGVLAVFSAVGAAVAVRNGLGEETSSAPAALS